MPKNRVDAIMNGLFVVMVCLTFISLFRVLPWLSGVLSLMFIFLIVLHIKDYKAEKPEGKKAFVLTILTLINFFLANAVVVLSEFIYPY